ncbi:MAG TPA: dynamin family protein, partial [Gaiellales bacterium]|nr:dynamin family protein [Gaiellales bacterium]
MVGRLIKRRGVLSRREAELRVRERALLERTSRVLDSLGGDAAEDDRRHMGEAERALEGFFLLVVAGEFNSGKSSVINVLIGERVLPEGVTPTTDRINLLHHGEQ